jgi:D-alanyl-D-alanine carboxypeptidase
MLNRTWATIAKGLLGDRLARKQLSLKNQPGHGRSFVRLGGYLRAFLITAVAPIFALSLVLASPAQAKYAAVVIDAKNGQVLYGANANKRHYPASITKVMTLFLMFDAIKAGKLSLDGTIKISRRAARQPASKLGIKAGKRLKVRTAIMALVVKSANDVATAVGEHMGGTERKFSYLMNKKAQATGMVNTTFRNASGLPNRRQLTTAHDLALMVRALQKSHPQFYKLFSTRSFRYGGRKHDNHNRLLDRYQGADGVKTGYIRASGFNLAASAKRAGRRLIGVVMGARSPRVRDLHMMGLLERGFEKVTRGRYIAYDYDRNLHIDASKRKTATRKKVRRARGARGRIRYARLTPPRRPVEIARATGEGSSYEPELKVAPEPKALNWEIQVGAFSRFAPAHLSVTRAMRRLPSLLARTRINIIPTREKGRTIYRARLRGLDADGAERACELLLAKQLPCHAIAPETTAKNLAPRR